MSVEEILILIASLRSRGNVCMDKYQSVVEFKEAQLGIDNPSD